MPKRSKKPEVTKPMQEEIKHEISNKQLAKLLDDLETLYKNVKLGNTTLSMEEESKYVTDYLKSLVLSKPESAASEKLLKPIMQEAGIENFPEGRVGGGWVDFLLPSSREVGPPAAIELKPLHDREGKLNSLSKEFDLLVESLNKTSSNQITKYILGGNGSRGVDYVVFTNLKDAYIFDKGCIAKFEPAKKETFREFIESVSVTKNISDYLRRVTEELEKRDLDKYFFNDLKKWYGYLQEQDWIDYPQENSVLLLNKLIFALTLEDFMIIGYRETWDMFSRNFSKWSAKGPRAVVKNFFRELDEFLYEYYDTELFVPSNSILSKLKDSSNSYSNLLKALRAVAGFVDEPNIFSGGLYSYNFRLINEDVFGKSYEMFLAENRKDSGIFYTPNQITTKMAAGLVSLLFGKFRDELIDDLNRENYDQAIEQARKLVRITVFDPACGSGAFLISVLREITKIYSDIKPKTEWVNGLGLEQVSDPEMDRIKKVRKVREILGFNGQMKGVDRVLLSKIILRHIYGSDLDGMALSVSKVNIWKETVKLNPESFYYQSLPESVNHILPDLKINLVRGNSIVTFPDEYVIKTLQEKHKNEIVRMLELRNLYLEDPSKAEMAEEIEEIKKPIRLELEEEFANTYPGFTHPLLYPLEFFFLYFDERGEPIQDGGKFSGLIGNPPWNNVKPHRVEFVMKHPEMFEGGVSRFSVMGKELDKLFNDKIKDTQVQSMWNQYTSSIYNLSKFIRKSYLLQGSGDTSLQKTFLEKFMTLTKDAFAILVPSNFHTDQGTLELRREIFNNWQLNEMISFENRRRVWFDMESRFKFDMLTVTKQKTGKPFKARFYVSEWEDIESAFDYPTDLIAELSPIVLGVTEFRSREDIDIIKRIRGKHLLLSQIGLKISSEFHETNDKYLFHTECGPDMLPLYSGRMIHQYNNQFANNEFYVSEEEGRSALISSQAKSVRDRLKNDSLPIPAYDTIVEMINRRELLMDYETERLVIRSFARSNDERTLIASIVPKGVFLTNMLTYFDPFLISLENGKVVQSNRGDQLYYLLALLNSFVLDYYIRQRVSAALNFFFIYELPIPDASEQFRNRIITLAKNLMKYPSNGQERAELEILIAKGLFKLSKDETEHILDSFVYGNIDRELIKLIKNKYEET